MDLQPAADHDLLPLQSVITAAQVQVKSYSSWQTQSGSDMHLNLVEHVHLHTVLSAANLLSQLQDI